MLNGQATLIINNSFIVAIAGSAESFLPNALGVGLPAIAVLLYAVGLFVSYVRRRRAGVRTSSLLWLVARIVIAAALVFRVGEVLEGFVVLAYSPATLFCPTALF